MKLPEKLKKIFLFLSLIAILSLVAPTGVLASLPTEKQFTGHVFDQSSDLYYMRARYYDPVIGRFIQPDSIIPSSNSPDVFNRYMYVKNNPMRLIDPSGNQGIGLGGKQAEYWQQNQMAIFDVVGGGFVVEGAESLFNRGVRWALNTKWGRVLTSKVDDLIVRAVSITSDDIIPGSLHMADEAVSAPTSITGLTVDDIIARVDPLMEARAPGSRQRLCGYSSYTTHYVAEQSGVPARVYQVRDLLGQMGVPAEETFKHVFTVVEAEGSPYLVDLTFSQFMNPEAGVIMQNPLSVGASISDPLAQQLLTRGYVPLTEETLSAYLNLTSSAEIGQVGLELLNQVPWQTWTAEYTLEEMLRILGGG